MPIKGMVKGFVYKVSEPYTVGEKAFEKQDLIFKVPAWRDEFGEVRGKDEYFKFEIGGDKVKELNLDARVIGQKAEATVYFRSSHFQRTDGSSGFIINGNVTAIAFPDGVPTPSTPQPPPQVVNSNDGLPF